MSNQSVGGRNKGLNSSKKMKGNISAAAIGKTHKISITTKSSALAAQNNQISKTRAFNKICRQFKKLKSSREKKILYNIFEDFKVSVENFNKNYARRKVRQQSPLSQAACLVLDSFMQKAQQQWQQGSQKSLLLQSQLQLKQQPQSLEHRNIKYIQQMLKYLLHGKLTKISQFERISKQQRNALITQVSLMKVHPYYKRKWCNLKQQERLQGQFVEREPSMKDIYDYYIKNCSKSLIQQQKRELGTVAESELKMNDHQYYQALQNQWKYEGDLLMEELFPYDESEKKMQQDQLEEVESNCDREQKMGWFSEDECCNLGGWANQWL